MKNRKIYLDHAATTYVDSAVLKEMLPYFSQKFANTSSLHSPGLEAKDAVSKARNKVAQILHSAPEEIIFTSGGTESINLAIKGVALANSSEKNISKGHIITSKIEHPAVLNTCQYLEKSGFKVTYLDVNKEGFVSLKDIQKAIRKDTFLISIMYANNEMGTIQPISEIGKIAKAKNILFHSDACQAGSLDLDVTKLNVDLLTLNGSKIYGPKGVGILYVKKGIKLEPLMHGGGHESGLRSGTLNTPGIIGFAKALELIQNNRQIENKRLIKLRDYFIRKVLTEIPQTKLNGPSDKINLNEEIDFKNIKRLPNNVNISFQNIEGESILLHLNEKNIYVSTGSACSSQKLEISHVLKAIKLDYKLAHGSIRFTLGQKTSKADLDYVVKQLKIIIQLLRKISPLK